FNAGTVYTESYGIMENLYCGDICCFQKVRILSDNRFATIDEMVAMNNQFADERHQERLGVALVKNTAEEILAVFDEMEARENGTWVTTPEDEELQQRYWSLITKTGHHGGRIGAQFLRDNQDLLR
ncbi:MAG: TIGR04372 family glycosyltransferase, partial [Actinomycetota bacterium]